MIELFPKNSFTMTKVDEGLVKQDELPIGREIAFTLTCSHTHTHTHTFTALHARVPPGAHLYDL